MAVFEHDVVGGREAEGAAEEVLPGGQVASPVGGDDLAQHVVVDVGGVGGGAVGLVVDERVLDEGGGEGERGGEFLQQRDVGGDVDGGTLRRGLHGDGGGRCLLERCRDVAADGAHLAQIGRVGAVAVEVGGGDGVDAEEAVPGGAAVGAHVGVAAEGDALSGGVVDGDDDEAVAMLVVEGVEGAVGLGAVVAVRPGVFLHVGALDGLGGGRSGAPADGGAVVDGVLLGVDGVAGGKKQQGRGQIEN